MAGMNLKEKGVFVFCVLHLSFNKHSYIVRSVIAPRIFDQPELILLLCLKILRSKQFKEEIKLQFQAH